MFISLSTEQFFIGVTFSEHNNIIIKTSIGLLQNINISLQCSSSKCVFYYNTRVFWKYKSNISGNKLKLKMSEKITFNQSYLFSQGTMNNLIIRFKVYRCQLKTTDPIEFILLPIGVPFFVKFRHGYWFWWECPDANRKYYYVWQTNTILW